MLLQMTTRSCASVPITMTKECILCQVLGIKHPDDQTSISFPLIHPQISRRDGVWLTIDCEEHSIWL